MSSELSPIDKAKFVAAKRAGQFVEDGMRVGLGTGSTAAWLVRCLGEMVREEGLRMNGDRPFHTDEGNYILDLHLNRIGNARQLSLVLNRMPGLVENGLFIDICDAVVIGFGDGKVEVRDINAGTSSTDRLDFVESDNLFADLGD
mgnify:CR=1 FL=1|jgi:ribose 5-phosphate isomerase